MRRLAGLLFAGLVMTSSLGACIPPEKALEEDLKIMLAGKRLADEVVFCRVSEGSRSGMCTLRLSRSDQLQEMVERLGLVELDPSDPESARFLGLWDDRVRCQRLAVFAPENQLLILRSGERSERIRIDEKLGFQHLVLYDSGISDLVCVQVAYIEGQEPGRRAPGE